MKVLTLNITLFTCFAVGLPLWLMQSNKYDYPSVHSCTGDCYEQWLADTGGVVAIAQAAEAAKASASPAELGEKLYIGCVACHGAGGGGGVGPKLAGQAVADIVAKLSAYKNGETIGAQSSLMWSQAAALSSDNIENLAEYISTL